MARDTKGRCILSQLAFHRCLLLPGTAPTLSEGLERLYVVQLEFMFPVTRSFPRKSKVLLLRIY